MAKNRTMRVAVLMLALTLITSCFVGGTFAKYITSDSATDKARVAKWGVEVTAFDNSSFKTEYTGTANAITVKSSNDDKLVAPGTADTEGVSFSIKGNPEVATKVTIDMVVTNDVKLSYSANPAGSIYSYYPVVYTLTHTYGAGAWSIAPAVEDTGAAVVTADGVDTITGTLAQIKAVLDKVSAGMTNVAPGYVYDDTFTLTWAWDFDDDGAGTNDVLDTALGNLAVDEADATFTMNDVEYTAGAFSTDIEYSINVTIEQVD